jgi:uncharacterized alkaline shock family protein YloU
VGAASASNSSMQGDHLAIAGERGTIRISDGVVADIAARTAARCYGVVALATPRRVRRLIGRGGAVSVAGDGDGLRIDLHVEVEYGLNLAEVAATLRSQVTYELERLTGLPVAAVDVHIDSARHG